MTAAEQLEAIRTRINSLKSSPLWLRGGLEDLARAIADIEPSSNDVINFAFDQSALTPDMTDEEIKDHLLFFARTVRLARELVDDAG